MDTAGMADLINNIAKSNDPVSSLWSSSRSFLIIWQNIELICEDKFRMLETFSFNLLKKDQELIGNKILDYYNV